MGSRCSKPVEQIKRKRKKNEDGAAVSSETKRLFLCVTTIHIYVFIITLKKEKRKKRHGVLNRLLFSFYVIPSIENKNTQRNEISLRCA